MDGDAWITADPTLCPECGRESCEDHLPPESPAPPPNEPLPSEAKYADLLHRTIDNERARRDARRIIDAEERPPEPIPIFLTVRERLAAAVERPPWRIKHWQQQNSRVICVAQFKAGKTTLRDNVARCLVDGDRFLGRDDVEPLRGSLVILDTEMSEIQMDHWLRDQAIQHDDRVLAIPLRGHASSFNILLPDVRRAWAKRLRERETEYLMLDCVRPVLDAIGLDEHHDAGRFLVAFDALLDEAEIGDALAIQHMGHTNERARGDSRLRDWPDVEWRLMRRDEDPSSARFITAYGRDVDVPESQLVYDPSTRHLTIEEGSRRDAKTRDALDSVLDLLRGNAEGLSGRAIKQELEESEHARNVIDTALRLGIRTKALTKRTGERNAKLYRVSVPSVP
jgi:hypothetical protein